MKATIRLLIVVVSLLPGLLKASIDLDEYKIDIAADKQTTFVFSNKVAGFWFGEVTGANRVAHQGLTILEQRYLKDYQLFIGDELLPRNLLHKASLYPDRLVRTFSPLTETIYFVDGLDGLVIGIESAEKLTAGFAPQLDGFFSDSPWEWNSDGQLAQAILYGVAEGKPSHMAVFAWGADNDGSATFTEKEHKLGRRSSERRQHLDRIAVKGATEVYFAVLVAADSASLVKKADSLRQNTRTFLSRRSSRLATLLNLNGIGTANSTFNLAARWAQISMDNLVTAQKGSGIWAGLPWFNNYWGRDTFIALPGALLATGQFETAAEVLRNFARFQQTSPISPVYGRIPNRIMLNETIYNTADGTPWFIRACDQYVRYSGDKDFIGEMFPVIHRTMEGALKHRVDEYGFLVHEDADTWMDAVGTEGPWSPRGNRAVEIQVLWMEQIRVAEEWAAYLGNQEQAQSWQILLDRVRKNFLRYYWQPGTRTLADHLGPRTIADNQIRPNAIFALTLPETPVLNPKQESAILRNLVPNLVYPWGVSSLDQQDASFHPWHHYPPFYVPDAAYHNGLIWTWLCGPYVSALVDYRPDMAMQLLQNTAQEILNDNAVGSQAELKEAWPRKNEPVARSSGTVSQAWNLAEFLRNLQQDLVGLRPRADKRQLYWEPIIPPDSLLPLNFNYRIGDDVIGGSISAEGTKIHFSLQKEKGPDNWAVSVSLPGYGNLKKSDTVLNGDSPLNFVLDRANNDVELNGKPVSTETVSRPQLEDLAFARPDLNIKVPALTHPGHYLISGEEASSPRGILTPILFDIADPEGDDKGRSGEYIYPANTNFVNGIFDIRRVKIWRDDQFLYFEVKYEDLVDPGWRPEPGYQLTYTAITLSFEKMKTIRRTKVEMNANHSVPAEYAYNFVIFVGNGYRLMDARGRIIAEYLPTDSEHPIGFVEDDAIRFSVPQKLLSQRQLKNAVVLSGGQDDHGGGGVGEFRAVLPERGEWHGGGAESDNSSNVYDELLIRR